MTEPFITDRPTLERARSMVRYIECDQWIAAFLGMPAVQVEGLRDELPRGKFAPIRAPLGEEPVDVRNETWIMRAMRANEGHLRLMLQYGVRHGLPNMTAAMVRDRLSVLERAVAGRSVSGVHEPLEVKAARASFDEPQTRWGERRRGSKRDDGREARSIPHSYGGEGQNYVD